MRKVARNSLKGYTYQQSVFILFLALMDTERKISKITVEALDTKNFDDIYLENVETDGGEQVCYRIQVKNYDKTELKDIEINNNTLTIKGNKNEFIPTDNNILVINTELIQTNDRFMGLPCIKIDNIIIIPLTAQQIADLLDDMFNTEARELQIMHKADEITINAMFEITIDELPEIIQMSIDLENETILLRNVPDSFEKKITFIEGKPGVGKSHFVNEICEKYPQAIVYRFWVGSQDPNRNRRIRFENFLSEMGIKIYNSAKKVDIEDLIDTMRKEDKLIIIDGLDHVENYNPQQLEDFVGFIDKLTDIRVIVLSRPLRYQIMWEKCNLLDWNFDETRLYLELAHNLVDYQIQNKIFRVSGGYPIITYFISEDYKLKQALDFDEPIAGVNDYYDKLFVNNERPSAAIGVFATGNCFFTWKELESFFAEPETYEVMCEFIDLHPYLFKRLMNRISLIHDSFNTYLRLKIKTFEHRKEKTMSIIRDSLLSGSIEYMDRMQAFDFDDEFYEIMLQKYADIDEFKRLMLSTRDYNSIQSLYIQLQTILEDRREVLDIYQYYSFVLLFQIANRNDLIGTDSLIFQMLLYMKKHGGIEDNIFSSDYIWQVHLFCMNLEEMTAKYLTNRHISDSQFYELIAHINEDYTFYEKRDKVIKYADFERLLSDEETCMMEKDKVLTDYLVSIWIHGNKEDKFYDSFVEYIQGNKECIIKMQAELAKYNFDRFWIDRSLNAAEYQLHELGFFGENNRFRNTSLLELIVNGAADGSYSAVTLAASYLKLANYEEREVDINSLAYAWSMYFNHKDYSVYTIDTALITFEKQKLIQEEESFEIISKLMAQSDDGISHLITSYVNKKGTEYIKKLNESGYLGKTDCRIRFWELDPECYKCFSKVEMAKQLTELLSIHFQSKHIEGRDIRNVMESNYRDMVLDGIEYYEYSILSPDIDLIPTLESRGIKYIGTTKQEKETYVPFHYGCIHEDDFEYISEQDVGYLEVAQYANGWYSCLPFVDVFSLYDKVDIQRDYIEIIHRAMYARVAGRDYLGDWSLLIGNIPALLLQYEIDIDWQKLYSVFKDFLDISLIWHAS